MSEELRPGTEPHWFGWRRYLYLAMADNLIVITRSSIFYLVLSRTMIQKEEGESQEALPGLSRTIPFPVLSVGGWYPKVTRGDTRSKMIDELIWLTFFHTE